MTAKAGFALRGHNPDVLTCIANLSNDEVFTPPEFANRLLDMLADAWAGDHDGANIWADSTLKFLDPCTKSGVFLREITIRLIQGLKDEFPDLDERVGHILTRQVFGIATTSLTSLLARRSVYCSKHALGVHSVVSTFASDSGNIWFERTEHSWTTGKCKYCGAGRDTFDRGEGLETYAYAFIHTGAFKTRLTQVFGGDMQFDVVIGNPPYQLASDGGTRDIPIYQRFVDQAKRLSPRYVVMVIPSRWMATGLGLREFREAMLGDRHVRQLVDFERMDQVFPGVDFEGGACYFLWNRDHEGLCDITSISGDERVGPIERRLDEFDVLVRDSRSLSVLRKVLGNREPSVTKILSVDKEFGWTSNFTGFHDGQKPGDVPIYYNRNGKRFTGWIPRKEVTKSPHLIDTWKVMIPKAYGERGTRPAKILGPSFTAPSPSVCTQTYLFFYLNGPDEAESLTSYLDTKFFRFLVSLRKITQDAARSTYTWVPIQAWDRRWTDEVLYRKYKLTADEIAHVETMIRPITQPDE